MLHAHSSGPTGPGSGPASSVTPQPFVTYTCIQNSVCVGGGGGSLPSSIYPTKHVTVIMSAILRKVHIHRLTGRLRNKAHAAWIHVFVQCVCVQCVCVNTYVHVSVHGI